MNKCTEIEIQEMLPDVLHGSLDGRERARLEAHLLTCESCREDLDVLRAVKSAAIFAPAIDVDRVVRQIPPYATILPGVEKPGRTRVVQWLVAAAVVLGVVGGGSLVLSKQIRTSQPPVAAIVPESIRIAKAPKVDDSSLPVPSPKITEVSATSRPQALALSTDVDNLSDGNLVQLMNEMDKFDALPAAEPEPVISVDSGDSL
jgi:hypothetical protein